MHTGTKRLSFETADDSSYYSSMQGIRMGGTAENQCHGASVTYYCSLPRADCGPQFSLFDPDKSFQQIAMCHLGISENQQKLSGEVFR